MPHGLAGSDGLASGAIFSWQQNEPGEKKWKDGELLDYSGVLCKGTLESTEANEPLEHTALDSAA